MQKFTCIDLFAGIGGFRIALNKIGGGCINFSEVNNDAINVYCTNFNDKLENNLGDITKIRALPAHDILTAGVPCQSWSIAGRNLGFVDDRGQLWNDTLYLLNQAQPKAFVFENVKGLADPRNRDALLYILKRIEEAGYYANYYVLNSFDYGVPQSRVRIYIIGFKEKKFASKFILPSPVKNYLKLAGILTGFNLNTEQKERYAQQDLFGHIIHKRSMSLSNNHGFNDYFLFNDLRNGHSTIHSWDILPTTDRQKEICYLLLKNRRKSSYGKLDGNPLALHHFLALDPTITQEDLQALIDLGILQAEQYRFSILKSSVTLSESENALLSCCADNCFVIDDLKNSKKLKSKKISVTKTVLSLLEKGVIVCEEVRYDFKNTKISTGLFGVNRIFLPSSNIFPTLVASDSNDFVTTVEITAETEKEYKAQFIERIYRKENYRKISKEEACRIQGFPENFELPESRTRWMKLLGNSVSVPVIETLCSAILKTGVFENT